MTNYYTGIIFNLNNIFEKSFRFVFYASYLLKSICVERCDPPFNLKTR